jgi:hypothetical protein
MGSTTSAPQPLRLEQPPGLEELDPSLLEHERLRERSFSVHTRRTVQPGNEKPRLGRWDRFVQEGARRVLNFTPSWFSVKYVVRLVSLHDACLILFVDSMGTGILSILLYTLPYQFNGLKTIGTIVFFLNLVLFVLFLVMSMYVPPASPCRTHSELCGQSSVHDLARRVSQDVASSATVLVPGDVSYGLRDDREYDRVPYPRPCERAADERVSRPIWIDRGY